MSGGPDCFCANGSVPPCPPCTVGAVVMLWADHPETLSVSIIKRRVRGITGHEAALLLEFTKRLPTVSPAHKANRNGKRYVERGPTNVRKPSW